jgi:hypothetical protein
MVYIYIYIHILINENPTKFSVQQIGRFLGNVSKFVIVGCVRKAIGPFSL